MKKVSFDDFAANYNNGQAQVLWKTLVSDLDTPVGAYLKLAAQEPYGFLLESVEGGEQLGRYSFIGFRPDLVWQHSHGTTKETINGHTRSWQDKQPLASLRQLVNSSQIPDMPDHLPPMAAGLVGCFSYDTVRWHEHIPDKNPDTLGLPEAVFTRPTMIAIFDRVKDSITVVTPVRFDKNVTASHAYHHALERLSSAHDTLSKPIPPHLLHSVTETVATIEDEIETKCCRITKILRRRCRFQF